MLQKTILIGNLGRDPEMRYTPNGTPVTQMSVATSRKWTDGNGEVKEETAWFRVSAFGKMAENCNQYLAKGRKVYVEGTLVVDPKTGGPRLYEKKDGTAGTSFEVRASTIKFLSPRGDGAGRDDSGVEHVGDGGSLTEEELPF